VIQKPVCSGLHFEDCLQFEDYSVAV
jgi:hypothetical protein